jgi:hypothetical protein
VLLLHRPVPAPGDRPQDTGQWCRRSPEAATSGLLGDGAELLARPVRDRGASRRQPPGTTSRPVDRFGRPHEPHPLPGYGTGQPLQLRLQHAAALDLAAHDPPRLERDRGDPRLPPGCPGEGEGDLLARGARGRLGGRRAAVPHGERQPGLVGGGERHECPRSEPDERARAERHAARARHRLGGPVEGLLGRARARGLRGRASMAPIGVRPGRGLGWHSLPGSPSPRTPTAWPSPTR